MVKSSRRLRLDSKAVFMKKILLLVAFLVLLFAVQYLWFKGTMRCVIARSEGGQMVDWALIKDCSY